MSPARVQCKLCQWTLDALSEDEMHPACAKYACPGCVANPKRTVYNILNFRNAHGFLCDPCDLDTVGIVTVKKVNEGTPARGGVKTILRGEKLYRGDALLSASTTAMIDKEGKKDKQTKKNIETTCGGAPIYGGDLNLAKARQQSHDQGECFDEEDGTGGLYA